MRIEFEHNFTLPHIPNLICGLKGHKWKKYVKQKPNRWDMSYSFMFGSVSVPTKQ